MVFTCKIQAKRFPGSEFILRQKGGSATKASNWKLRSLALRIPSVTSIWPVDQVNTKGPFLKGSMKYSHNSKIKASFLKRGTVLANENFGMALCMARSSTYSSFLTSKTALTKPPSSTTLRAPEARAVVRDAQTRRVTSAPSTRWHASLSRSECLRPF